MTHPILAAIGAAWLVGWICHSVRVTLALVGLDAARRWVLICPAPVLFLAVCAAASWPLLAYFNWKDGEYR